MLKLGRGRIDLRRVFWYNEGEGEEGDSVWAKRGRMRGR